MSKIFTELDKLFNMESVAIIGASGSFNKTGTAILFSIIAGGFKGTIYPINPKEKEIFGIKTYENLKSTPTKIDLAIICIRAEIVPQVIKECSEADIGYCIVISAGFGEVNEEGKELEKEVLEAAKMTGMRILGPNCMGIMNSDINFYALMNMLIPIPGNASIISQSGTIGSLSCIYGSEQRVGFNKYISIGNSIDLDTEDFIEYLTYDNQTKIISVFIEGIKNGKRFIEVAKKASKKKPLIVLKGGVTEAGARAAISHTGSLAGSSDIYDAAVKQTGIIQASCEKEMVDLIKAFSLLSLPKGRNVGITGVWGGLGVLTSDACSREGLIIPELSRESIEELNEHLPPIWSHGNPVDITGAGFGGSFNMLLKPIEVLLRDQNIDILIAMVPALGSFFTKIVPRMEPAIAEYFSKTSMGSMANQEMQMAKDIIEIKKRYDKPILSILIGFYGQDKTDHINFLEDNGIPVFESSQQAARVISKMITYKEFLEKVGI